MPDTPGVVWLPSAAVGDGDEPGAVVRPGVVAGVAEAGRVGCGVAAVDEAAGVPVDAGAALCVALADGLEVT